MLVESVKPVGRIGVVGVFPSKDAKSKDKFEKQGQIVFAIGKFFEKGLFDGLRAVQRQSIQPPSLSLIASGKAKPSFLVSHQLSLDEAPEAYKHFDDRGEGWTKVVLKPGAPQRADKKESSGKAGVRGMKREHGKSASAHD
jgi:glutathione-independent formaldehyde dehydrogenase